VSVQGSTIAAWTDVPSTIDTTAVSRSATTSTSASEIGRAEIA
jgi:hypothetical protein